MSLLYLYVTEVNHTFNSNIRHYTPTAICFLFPVCQQRVTLPSTTHTAAVTADLRRRYRRGELVYIVPGPSAVACGVPQLFNGQSQHL